MRQDDDLPVPAPRVVTGQHVTHEQVTRAKTFRDTMTVAERLLWKQLKANRLGGWHFRRQQIIDGYFVDFYCHSTGLIVEVDGEIHLRRRTADAERDARLSAHGLLIIRVTNADVRERMAQVLARIVSACQSRGNVNSDRP